MHFLCKAFCRAMPKRRPSVTAGRHELGYVCFAPLRLVQEGGQGQLSRPVASGVSSSDRTTSSCTTCSCACAAGSVHLSFWMRVRERARKSPLQVALQRTNTGGSALGCCSKIQQRMHPRHRRTTQRRLRTAQALSCQCRRAAILL